MDSQFQLFRRLYTASVFGARTARLASVQGSHDHSGLGHGQGQGRPTQNNKQPVVRVVAVLEGAGSPTIVRRFGDGVGEYSGGGGFHGGGAPTVEPQHAGAVGGYDPAHNAALRPAAVYGRGQRPGQRSSRESHPPPPPRPRDGGADAALDCGALGRLNDGRSSGRRCGVHGRRCRQSAGAGLHRRDVRGLRSPSLSDCGGVGSSLTFCCHGRVGLGMARHCVV